MVSQAARKDQLDPDPLELSKPTMEFRFVKRRNAKVLQQKHQVWNTRKAASAASREEWRDVPMVEDAMDEQEIRLECLKLACSMTRDLDVDIEEVTDIAVGLLRFVRNDSGRQQSAQDPRGDQPAAYPGQRFNPPPDMSPYP